MGNLTKTLEGYFFFSSRRRHTRSYGDWSSEVCSSDLYSRPAKNRRSAQDIWIFDDHAVPRAHTISITHSIALSSGTFPYLSLAKIITVAMLQRPRLGVGQSFGEPQGQARRVYSGRSVPCLGCTRSMLRWHLSICTGIRIEASDLDDDQSSSRRVSSPAASVLL